MLQGRFGLTDIARKRLLAFIFITAKFNGQDAVPRKIGGHDSAIIRVQIRSQSEFQKVFCVGIITGLYLGIGHSMGERDEGAFAKEGWLQNVNVQRSS